MTSLLEPELRPATRTARLSLQALQYGAALLLDDARFLASRLYCFHRIPASPRWKGRLPDRDAVARFLGLKDGLRSLSRFSDEWQLIETGLQRDDWFHWRRRPTGVRRHVSARCKLYVSPIGAQLPETWAILRRSLADTDALAFKIAATAAACLRPDKLLIYFEDFAALERCRRLLARALRGIEPHGVPFTAELAHDGLLAWGIDPPARSGARDGRTSWRAWIALRLARRLIAAQRRGDAESWRQAWRGIARDGVDPATFAPPRERFLRQRG